MGQETHIRHTIDWTFSQWKMRGPAPTLKSRIQMLHRMQTDVEADRAQGTRKEQVARDPWGKMSLWRRS